MDKPQPYQLWKQAEGDVARYMTLLVEHRYVIPRELEEGLSDGERLVTAVRRERAEAEARDLKRQFDSHRLSIEDSRATTAAGEVVTGIICGGRTGRNRCQVCKKHWSVAQCDYPTGGPCMKCKGAGQVGAVRPANCHDCAGTGRAMCNRRLCGNCRAKGPGQDEDYCPDHRTRAGLKLKRETCSWTNGAEPLLRRDCLHAGCQEVVEYGARVLYFPLRRRAMCASCGEAYMEASE
jgi:hypothetical protein